MYKSPQTSPRNCNTTIASTFFPPHSHHPAEFRTRSAPYGHCPTPFIQVNREKADWLRQSVSLEASFLLSSLRAPCHSLPPESSEAWPLCLPSSTGHQANPVRYSHLASSSRYSCPLLSRPGILHFASHILMCFADCKPGWIFTAEFVPLMRLHKKSRGPKLAWKFHLLTQMWS